MRRSYFGVYQKLDRHPLEAVCVLTDHQSQYIVHVVVMNVGYFAVIIQFDDQKTSRIMIHIPTIVGTVLIPLPNQTQN